MFVGFQTSRAKPEKSTIGFVLYQGEGSIKKRYKTPVIQHDSKILKSSIPTEILFMCLFLPFFLQVIHVQSRWMTGEVKFRQIPENKHNNSLRNTERPFL